MDRNRDLLVEVMAQRRLTIHSKVDGKGEEATSARGEESVIEDILSSEEMSGKVSGMHVDNSSEHDIDSDHNVIRWELDFVQHEGMRKIGDKERTKER